MITARLYLGYKDTSQPNPFINSSELPKWAEKAWDEEEEERETMTTLFSSPWQGMKVRSREVWLWNVSLMSIDTWTQNTCTEGDAAPWSGEGGFDLQLLPMNPEDSLGGYHHANSEPQGHGPGHAPASAVWLWMKPYLKATHWMSLGLKSEALKFYDSTQVCWSTEWYLGQDVHCLGERGEPWPVPCL